ncbi:MAG: NUDIX domain-containing protein [Lachnospiraceae bacterium]|nr:NUDIX domain-containing protein [Lachnospiraceae bacterium]
MRLNLTTQCYLEKDDSYLMMHRVKKEKDINKDKWIGIGGHFEGMESPEECLLRETMEETGLRLTSWQFRGIVTFIADQDYIEYMCLYTADAWEEIKKTTPCEDSLPVEPCCAEDKTERTFECDEGVLEWVPKKEVYQLPIWEGDRIFLRLLEERQEFFSLKLRYEGDRLVEAVLDGEDVIADASFRETV